ncbi:uncharacterized protein BYT42DRAFT_116801 [Radiomyces spectabilis]|uniref:uncharacterized protein n=1 Tax=Radiomyces spectabilis TaxID=64574 RepID=UPI00221FD254|nr:uncharacterized protein BYT42DRAFT_116801 [Radiomyces spectabilis]KAI8369632.1 hypothetical protein BYT42DRAFT_116801 [Radiomyces spectabilis]
MSAKVAPAGLKSMDSTTSNDRLWEVVEIQRVIIQNLEEALAKATTDLARVTNDLVKVTTDRDHLLKVRENSIHQNGFVVPHCSTPMTASTAKGVVDDMSHEGMSRSSVEVMVDMPSSSPVPPPRSPFRQNTAKDQYAHKLIVDAGTTTTTTTTKSTIMPSHDDNENFDLSDIQFPQSPSTSSSDTPISPVNITVDKDAQLFLKHQEMQTKSGRPTTPRTRKSSTQASVMQQRVPALHAGRPVILRNSTPFNSSDPAKDALQLASFSNTSSDEDRSSEEINDSYSTADPMAHITVTDLHIKVVGSNITVNHKGKEVVAFLLSVRQKKADPAEEPQELWCVQKFYSDFLDLDNQLKVRSRSSAGKPGKLPDKALFTTYAPNKVDQRKMAIEKYLQYVINMSLHDTTELCRFISSNRVDTQNTVNMISGHRQGYLTKRGKSFGGWKSRYFVLDGPILRYYDMQGGSLLGVIHLSEAQVCRQNSPPSSANGPVQQHKHAFMILEPKKSVANGVHKHLLCAYSDTERDEWIEALNHYANLGLLRQETKRKVSKEDIKPISAMPISQLSSIDYAGKFSTNISPAMLPYYPPRSNSDSSIHPCESTISDSSIPSSTALLDMDSPPLLRQRSSMDHPFFFSQQHQTHHSSTFTSDFPSYGTPTHESISGPVSPCTTPTLEEETSLECEGRKTKQKANRRTFWSKKIFTGSSNDTSGAVPTGGLRGFLTRSSHDSNADQTSGLALPLKRRQKSVVEANIKSPNQVFGVPLMEAVQVCRTSETCELPAIVHRCIEYLEAKNATREEGIYRLSGSATKIKSLKQKFDELGDYDLLASNEYHDIHAIAGLLKMWLRELPENVLTQKRLREFLAVIVDRQERVNELGRLVSQLPIANYWLLRALTVHLIHVVENSDINKMTVRNVGIVFSPTLGIPAGIFSLFLSEFDYIFYTDNATATESAKSDSELLTPEYALDLHPTQPLPTQSTDHAVGSQRIHQIVRDEKGRNNRNSVHYMDGAPQSIVNLEAQRSGNIVDDDEEVNDLDLPMEDPALISDDDEDNLYSVFPDSSTCTQAP